MKTYNDRNSKPQQMHRLGTVGKNITVCVCVCVVGVGVGGARRA